MKLKKSTIFVLSISILLTILYVIYSTVSLLPNSAGVSDEISITEEQQQTITVPQIVPGEFLIKLKAGTNSQQLSNSLKIESTTISNTIKGTLRLVKNTNLIKKSEPILNQIQSFQSTQTESGEDKETLLRLQSDLYNEALLYASHLQARDDILIAEPNYVYQTNALPNDPLIERQWSFKNDDNTDTPENDIDMDEAWDYLEQNPINNEFTPIVAVIDTGVDYNHPDLKDRILKNSTGKIVGYDFFTNDSDPMDEENGHGTHVAGTIAAQNNNGIGVAGICDFCKIMPIRFIGPDGGTLAGAISSVHFATANGAHVLNNSWGGTGKSILLEEAFKEASKKNIASVVAAGNSFSQTEYYPAFYEDVFAVAASDNKGGAAIYSNYGTHVDITAPGGWGGYAVDCKDKSILSTITKGKLFNQIKPDCKIEDSSGVYGAIDGTSMATPHVAGAIGLLLKQDPSQSINKIYQRLLANVDNFSTALPSIRQKGMGLGILNVNNALRNLEITSNKFEIYRVQNTDKASGEKNAEILKNSEHYMDIFIKNYYGTTTFSELSASIGTTPAFRDCMSLGELKDVSNVKLEGFINGFVMEKALTWKFSDACPAKYEGKASRITLFFNIRATDFSVATYTYVDRIAFTKPGWPKNIGTTITGSSTFYADLNETVVDDIDGDGKKDILRGGDKMYIFDDEGNNKAGWPQRFISAKEQNNSSDPYKNIYPVAPTIGNIDSDPEKEIIVPEFVYRGTPAGSANPTNLKLNAWNIDGTRIDAISNVFQTNSQGRIGHVTLADVNKDGVDEIFFSTIQEVGNVAKDKITLNIISLVKGRYQLKKFELKGPHYMEPIYSSAGGAYPVAFDIDKDNLIEVFFATNANIFGSLKQMYIHQIKYEKPGQYSLKTSGSKDLHGVNKFTFADLNNDSKFEMIASGFEGTSVTTLPGGATGGVRMNPRIAVFDFEKFSTTETDNNHPLWRAEGGKFALLDVDNDSNIEVITSKLSPLQPQGYIYQLIGYFDFEGNWKDWQKIANLRDSNYPTIVDIDNDGEEDVIAVGRQDSFPLKLLDIFSKTGEDLIKKYWEIYDQDISSKKTFPRQYYERRSPALIEDLDGDGKNEIIMTLGADELYVIPTTWDKSSKQASWPAPGSDVKHSSMSQLYKNDNYEIDLAVENMKFYGTKKNNYLEVEIKNLSNGSALRPKLTIDSGFRGTTIPSGCKRINRASFECSLDLIKANSTFTFKVPYNLNSDLITLTAKIQISEHGTESKLDNNSKTQQLKRSRNP